MSPAMERHFADVFSVKELKMGRFSWFTLLDLEDLSVWGVLVVNKWEDFLEKPDSHLGSGNTSPPSSDIPSLLWR